MGQDVADDDEEESRTGSRPISFFAAAAAFRMRGSADQTAFTHVQCERGTL